MAHVMEKAPGTPRQYQYVVVDADCKPDTFQRIQQALGEGYRVAGITPAGIVLERLEGSPAETQPAGNFGSELSTRPQYLCLDTNRLSTLRQEMDEAAAAGYRVITFGFGTVMYLEKAVAPPATYAYKLLSSPEGLAEAGAAGFRFLPESSRGGPEHPRYQGLLVGDRLRGGSFLMEKPPTSMERYEYLVVRSTRVREDAPAVNRASQQGYSVVGATRDKGFGICVMEKPAAPPPE